MSAMIQALDSFTPLPVPVPLPVPLPVLAPLRSGENGHAELDWQRDLQEKIVQFDFQCVRTDADGLADLAKVLDGLLCELSTSTSYTGHKEHLVTLYKIIAKTRDINGGKGEYMLSYMMIFTWHKYFPNLALNALQMFVIEPREIDESLPSQEPYGSWKDIKYFCKYILDNGGTMEHPLVQSCIAGINRTLRMDESVHNYSHQNANKKLTLVSKWIPREDTKFGFLYEALAIDYFKEFMATAKTDSSRAKAVKKCKAQYRMLCSKLNRHLDTVQIKQTSKNWSEINHAKTTSITMAKQRKAFLNQKKVGGEARSEDPDRVQCAENLRAYLDSLKKEGKEVKGKNVGLEMFGAQALGILDYSYNSIRNQEEAHILNSQWRDNCNKKNANSLGPMVAIVDTSGSMSGDPLCAALSLGCRVAENSILGKRVMTFSAEPAWINLDGKETFTDMVGAIMRKSNTAGLNTNFYKALDLILTVIEEKQILAADVENMILAVFSDMQIDDNLHVMATPGANNYNPTETQKFHARGKWATMHEQIKTKYAEVGMRLYGQPLNLPHILFWNLRKTNGFPTLSTEAGCSMMSGYDPTILNMFCETGMEALKEMTPYKTLLKILDNPRYLPMETVIRSRI